MKKIKSFFRILLFIVFIMLATLGVGISGGVPLPILRRQAKKETTIEKVERKRDETLTAE